MGDKFLIELAIFIRATIPDLNQHNPVDPGIFEVLSLFNITFQRMNLQCQFAMKSIVHTQKYDDLQKAYDKVMNDLEIDIHKCNQEILMSLSSYAFYLLNKNQKKNEFKIKMGADIEHEPS